MQCEDKQLFSTDRGLSDKAAIPEESFLHSGRKTAPAAELKTILQN